MADPPGAGEDAFDRDLAAERVGEQRDPLQVQGGDPARERCAEPGHVERALRSAALPEPRQVGGEDLEIGGQMLGRGQHVGTRHHEAVHENHSRAPRRHRARGGAEDIGQPFTSIICDLIASRSDVIDVLGLQRLPSKGPRAPAVPRTAAPAAGAVASVGDPAEGGPRLGRVRAGARA
jgi:hypothetical protein